MNVFQSVDIIVKSSHVLACTVTETGHDDGPISIVYLEGATVGRPLIFRLEEIERRDLGEEK